MLEVFCRGIFLEEIKPDIMSIQEVKLTQEEVNLRIRFNGYSVYYKPRKINPNFGGGVLLLIRDTIANSAITGLEVTSDHIGLKIESKGLCFHLVSLYAPTNKQKFETVSVYSKLGGDHILT